MADKIFAGLDASAIETVPKFEPITKVTVTNGENSWSRGDDTGRELRVDLQIANSTNGDTFAQNILAKVSGLQYQPYNASGALIDPAAEIGDGVTIGGVYGGIYEQNSRFDQLHSSDIGAVADEELDNEYPYLSAQERDAIRQRTQTEANTSAIETNTSDIADVDSRVSSIEADYINTQELNAVSARVGQIESDYIKTNQLNAVSARVSTLEANQITVGYLQANYCEIDGATINNLKARIASFESIEAGNANMRYCYVNNFSCKTSGGSVLINGNRAAVWPVKTTGGATINVLGY